MKSSHADAAAAEWFDSFGQRTEKMAEREAKQQKAASVVSTLVRECYHCPECALTTESQVAFRLCAGKGHAVRAVRGVKWFFECAVCRRRDYTLTVAPSSSSSGSGHASKGGSGGGGGGGGGGSSSGDGSGGSGAGFHGRQHPTQRCTCGAFDWRACGRLGTFATDDKEHEMVLSATDWTSRKDLVKIAALKD
jgi:hypothetical protein